jgi:hypothetical protein
MIRPKRGGEAWRWSLKTVMREAVIKVGREGTKKAGRDRGIGRRQGERVMEEGRGRGWRRQGCWIRGMCEGGWKMGVGKCVKEHGWCMGPGRGRIKDAGNVRWRLNEEKVKEAWRRMVDGDWKGKYKGCGKGNLRWRPDGEWVKEAGMEMIIGTRK